MDNRERFVELIGQTLAPRLYDLFGTPPEEMGFPVGDSKADFEEQVERQFNPIEYWTARGREIGQAVLNILEAGGVSVADADVDAMCKAALKERPDSPSH